MNISKYTIFFLSSLFLIQGTTIYDAHSNKTSSQSVCEKQERAVSSQKTKKANLGSVAVKDVSDNEKKMGCDFGDSHNCVQ